MAKKEEKAKKAVTTEKEKPREQKTQSLADTKTSAAKTVKKASEQLPAKPATSETAKSSGTATKARTVGGDAKKAPATKAKTSIERTSIEKASAEKTAASAATTRAAKAKPAAANGKAPAAKPAAEKAAAPAKTGTSTATAVKPSAAATKAAAARSRSRRPAARVSCRRRQSRRKKLWPSPRPNLRLPRQVPGRRSRADCRCFRIEACPIRRISKAGRGGTDRVGLIGVAFGPPPPVDGAAGRGAPSRPHDPGG